MRIDIWLWAVRLFKSRSVAASTLRSGRVRVNGTVAKPATSVQVGDRVTWRDPLRDRVVVVRELLPKRVGAPLAVKAYTDQSPPVPTREERAEVGLRDRGAGRPTKRERRDIDRLRGRR
ncbi:RNA-binding S4 domain-containing protein [Isoptericola dokdonensis]|jgi:ribosome-associated heat shock protein Hsp15|uniref:Heat shock protein 15 n=1 Tax=Isoptericola dokdonensis DS-3 TaxID=1300344 RepID=A0A161HSC4_9MICO|nr:RNA-binding S4 domain-containing protein [Isoptericola dokdonensis]ANC32342.1 Heat shock protein 15 [Isoptericola dokdonensis DS-3]